jgi:putative phosphoribosyl transferase
MKNRMAHQKPIPSGCNAMHAPIDEIPWEVVVGRHQLRGLLCMHAHADGLVIFAHGSGSGRLSPRNNRVAAALCRDGMATLLIDLLTESEEKNRAHVFDIKLLSTRLASAAAWARAQTELRDLPIGYFGASTGAAAALTAAAQDPAIAAVVSRGGRPDLAYGALPLVRAPTLLLVGSLDGPVITLNRQAYAALTCHKEMLIGSGAGHLFEEPGTLDQVVAHASGWFSRCFARPEPRQVRP